MNQAKQFVRSPLIMLAFAGLVLSGCNPSANERAEEVAAASAASSAADLPSPLVPAAEAGEKGARNVLLGFARALENKQFGTAWALLGPAARGEGSEAQFAVEWNLMRDISVAIVDGDIEGAAGSLYYTSPVTITALDAAGRRVRYEGPVVLRRVNDVRGATEAQLRWHIESLALVWTH